MATKVDIPTLEDIPTFEDKAPVLNSNISTVSPQSLVPKLTLKLASCQSPTPIDSSQKCLPKEVTTPTVELSNREPSPPELVRISPLVTRPPKQKPVIGMF